MSQDQTELKRAIVLRLLELQPGQTTAPQTTAPQTTAPQTTAPQTTAPQTTAPRVDPRARLAAELARQQRQRELRATAEPLPLSPDAVMFQQQLPDFHQARAEADVTPQMEKKFHAARTTMAENAPAVGATLATLPMGGAPAIGTRLLSPTLGQSLKKIGGFVGDLAGGAVRAGAGAASGEAVFGHMDDDERAPVDRMLDEAYNHGITDPVARLTAGLGKFLLRPAGEALSQKTRRLIEFAREQRLPIDPGTSTDRFLPNIVGQFAKNFFPSRHFSRQQMRAVVELLSSDPNKSSAFFKQIIGDVDGEALNKALVGSLKSIDKLSKNSTHPVIRAASRESPESAAWVLFKDADAVAVAKRTLSKTEFRELAEAHVQTLITRAQKDGVINGARLGREIKSHRKMLEDAHGFELVQRLENFAMYAEANKDVMTELAEPFITASAFATTAVAGVPMALDPTTVGGAGVLLSKWLAANVFDSRSGLSRWMTNGLIPDSKALQLTGRLAFHIPVRRNLADMVGGFRGDAKPMNFAGTSDAR